MKIERPKGTRDFSPEEMLYRKAVKDGLFKFFGNYGYQRIKTPTFEHADLFTQKSGDEVAGHMFVFEDKKGRTLCLRPEETASVARMFSDSLRNMPLPVKVCYFESMFRYEEPQKGRYREFWQMGLELIGPKSGYSDAEVIALAYESLRSLGLSFRLEVSHIGIIKGLLSELQVSEADQRKVIALIDKKDLAGAKKIVADKVLYDLLSVSGDFSAIGKAEKILAGHAKPLSALSELRFIVEALSEVGVKYVINYSIARGLEYYTGMVFEVRVEGLGAQNQIAGGGRYDNLIELFSGLSVPAVGFAFGFDRVVEALQMQKIKFQQEGIDIVVAPGSADVRLDAFKIASSLRQDYSVDLDLLDRKLSKILEYAGLIKAKYAVIVGKKDLEAESVTLRDMSTGAQEQIEIAVLAQELKERIK